MVWLALLLGCENVSVARLVGTGQGCTRALAQAKTLVLSEAPSRLGERRSPKRVRVRALACCSCFSPGEELHLWARGCLAQARRARLSEPYESLPVSPSRSRLSESPPPERGHSSRLSEDSWLERDSLRVALFS
ncbi:hypothetical protein DEO72_LG1g3142 [Vigna unguiculata]|uniref:Uncharacterized protein n=1 Tax=Vigna unguiculata TaxID=3917 RepID=A0A4D6KS22_VIGUN|nr:hypothetical protein DEO72_LG1g3142 [Vigna unguiculata]